MSAPPASAGAGPPIVLTRRPESCLLQSGGALVAIRRAPLDRAQLADVRRAMDEAVSNHAGGLVMLSAFRLSPDFPLRPGVDTDLRELADTLRALDRALAASATVIEFGGIRGAAMRVASRTVWSLARPRAVMGHFERLSDAVAWLLPHARVIGAPDDAATYVRLYREADRILEELDAERWVRGGAVGRSR